MLTLTIISSEMQELVPTTPARELINYIDKADRRLIDSLEILLCYYTDDFILYSQLFLFVYRVLEKESIVALVVKRSIASAL